MVEEPAPLLPRAEESIEAETDTALASEPETGEPAPEPASEPGFVCDCEKSMRAACASLPFYREREGRHYCVLHYPGKEKSADFKTALDAKLDKKDFDFRGVWFPDEVDFNDFEFSAAADFSFSMFCASARFRNATFSRAAEFLSATFTAYSDFTFAEFNAYADFSFAAFSADAYFSSTAFSADAYFSSATFSADASFSSAAFSANASFRSTMFSADADFISAIFGADADFISATFKTAADFRAATFRAAADFNSATFTAAADFSSAKLNAATYFSSARFSAAVDFNLSVFHARTDFSGASFNDSLHFFGSPAERLLKDDTNFLPAMALGKSPSLDFQHVRIEHPDRTAFHTLNLRPHWFVNVDSREFVFTDVSWEWEHISITEEIAALEANNVLSPNRLLAIACRQLAENAETNNRYEEASRFRYWAMDLARRDKWKRGSFWKPDWLLILYWAVSGFGERIRNALGVLAAVWIVFALLYPWVGFTEELKFPRTFSYSIAVMSLQKPEPRPLTNWAHALVTFETILGPVQGALLALAIRRKFMR